MKKKKRAVILCFTLCLLLLSAGAFFAYRGLSERTEESGALADLRTLEYQSVFLSMYDVGAFPTEAFAHNRGIPTYKPDCFFPGAEELNAALKNVFRSGNRLTNIFLGLDPFSALSSSADLCGAFEKGWLSYADEYPLISFNVLFSFPSIDRWVSLSEEERDACLSLYEGLVECMGARSNIKMYYVGGEDWLVCNPANYTGFSALNSQVAEKLFLYTFCDGCFEITRENSLEMLGRTLDLIDAETAAPAEYPDLSRYDIVFIGDSILANDAGSLSIPDIIHTFSGASVFNCAQGGTCAAEPAPEALCFPKMANEFLSGQPEAPDTVYGRGILEYASADHSGKETCFVFHFGVNDYFSGIAIENAGDGYDILTYTGAMRAAIADLAAAYPDALFIVMGPGRITQFNNGTDLINGSDQLSHYYAAAAALSEELGVPYLDLYRGFPENGEELADVLLWDGVHYNEHGRFTLSKRIMDFIAAHLRSS